MNRLLAQAALGSLLVFAIPRLVHAGPQIKVGNGTAASCTETALRNALALAEGQGGGTISFRCGLRPATIPVLESLVVPDNTTINGGGLVTLRAAIIDNVTRLSTVVSVAGDTTVILTNITIGGGFNGIYNGGTLTLHNSTVASGINHNVVNAGTLTVLNSTLMFEIQDIAGGGILNGGTLAVNNSTFTNNLGGGIANGGVAIVTNSIFSSNRYEEGHGGAIINTGDFVLRNSTVFNNVSAHGGAIHNDGALTIQNSAITGNHGSFGGGIYNAGTLSVRNSAITGNSASVDGGGIYTCCGGTTTLRNAAVIGNTPDDIVDVP